MNPTSYLTNQNEFNSVLGNVIENINKGIEKYWTTHGFTYCKPPQIRVSSIGKKFIKLCRFEEKYGSFTGTSVYCFIDLNNGNIYKAASYLAPAKGVRGNIFLSDVLDHLTVYGAEYNRGCSMTSISHYLSTV